jgi:acetyltransferase-like isoleucine patch superfamily enzyme
MDYKMFEPDIKCKDLQVEEDFEVGANVKIKAEVVRIGKNVKIGVNTSESFRNPGGVRIEVRNLIINDNVSINRESLIQGGSIELGSNVTVREQSTINVMEDLQIGPGSYINPYCRILGRNISIGAKFRMLSWSLIGGGSCFEVQSRLKIGSFCHLGEFSQINTAHSVEIGDEVGIGIRSGIFTHGAYQSFLLGYPVSFGPVVIEEKCWLPHAYVLPNVVIGKGTVVAAGSVVTKNLPEYSLAGGVPARVIDEGRYKKKPGSLRRLDLLQDFMSHLQEILNDDFDYQSKFTDDNVLLLNEDRRILLVDEMSTRVIQDKSINSKDIVIIYGSPLQRSLEDSLSVIDTVSRTHFGPQNELMQRVMNQLRRYGHRFPQDADTI